MNKAEARSFIQAIVDKALKKSLRQLPGFRWGEVTATSTGPPKTITVAVGGNFGNPITMRYLSSYTPTVGDTVVLYQQGGDRVAIDKLA